MMKKKSKIKDKPIGLFKENWWAFWDNVDMPLLNKIRRVKRKKSSVWDLK